MFKIISVFISITFIMYLFGSFYHTTFDIKYWTQESRSTLLILDGILFIGYIIVNFLEGNYSKNKDLKLKKIFDSANVIPINVDKGLVFCGFRHLQCMRTMGSITGLRSVRSVVGNYIQGFLTSKNRFVGREEAKIIALDAKQIVEPTINKTDLFSEDLW